MHNIADILMYVLESFLDSEPRTYPTIMDVTTRIQERYPHLRHDSSLKAEIRKRLDSLLDSRILLYRKKRKRGGKGKMTIGPRWQRIPVDQLEE